jgi:hypothetical protein
MIPTESSVYADVWANKPKDYTQYQEYMIKFG